MRTMRTQRFKPEQNRTDARRALSPRWCRVEAVNIDAGSHLDHEHEEDEAHDREHDERFVADALIAQRFHHAVRDSLRTLEAHGNGTKRIASQKAGDQVAYSCIHCREPSHQQGGAARSHHAIGEPIPADRDRWLTGFNHIVPGLQTVLHRARLGLFPRKSGTLLTLLRYTMAPEGPSLNFVMVGRVSISIHESQDGARRCGVSNLGPPDGYFCPSRYA